MQRLMLKAISFLVTFLAFGCAPQEPEGTHGYIGQAPCPEDVCFEGLASPAGVCLDVVPTDATVEDCHPMADAVSDPVDVIGGQRFCLATCETDEDCQAAATGLAHDLTCLNIDNTHVCGLSDESAKWPE